MTSERLFNSFIPPQNFYTPPKKISGYAPGVCVFSVFLCLSDTDLAASDSNKYKDDDDDDYIKIYSKKNNEIIMILRRRRTWRRLVMSRVEMFL